MAINKILKKAISMENMNKDYSEISAFSRVNLYMNTICSWFAL